jgi:hypothetical protein
MVAANVGDQGAHQQRDHPRLEIGRRRASDDSMFAIRRAFEGAGVEFSPSSANLRKEKSGP